MRFQDIAPAHPLAAALTKAVQGQRLSHGQLLFGDPIALHLGLGLAGYLLCTQRTKDACGTCQDCLLHARYCHADVHFLVPSYGPKLSAAELLASWRSFLRTTPQATLDAWQAHMGENTRAIPSISRQAVSQLLEQIRLHPVRGKAKVVLIWLAEYMHPSAANALLKTLEEPPQNTYFLLISQERGHILPTLQSRVQLRYTAPVHPAPLLVLPQRDAAHTQACVQWLRACYSKSLAQCLQQAEVFHKQEARSQEAFLAYTLACLRASLLLRTGALQASDVQDNPFVHRLSCTLNMDKLGPVLSRINRAIMQLRRHLAARLVYMELSQQLMEAFHTHV